MIEAGAVALVLVAMMVFAGKKGAAGEVGESLGAAAGSAIAGAAGGVVLGVGDGLGIPRTDLSECERAKLEGRTWDASFACGAGDFIGYWWNK